MNIYVWDNFSKRKNSTKQPTGGTTIDVKLKDNCSQESPVFILSTGGAIPNYTYVSAFGNYYFVSDIVNINAGMCEVHCKKDVLASHKSEISSTSAFVVYDTTSNSDIIDTRLATQVTPTVQQNSVDAYDNFSTTGCIVATITSDEGTDTFAISSQAIDRIIPDTSQQVWDFFIQNTTIDPTPDLTAFSNNFFQVMGNAIRQIISSGHIAENIQDIRWLPFDFTSGTQQYIKIGQYSSTLAGVPMDSRYRIYSNTASVSIPWQFSDWRNSDPYTQIYLRIPYVGIVSYPASSLKGMSALTMRYSIDKMSGDIAVEIIAGSNVLGTYGASTAVKIPIGNSSANLGQIMNNLMAVPFSALSGKVDNIASSISSFMLSVFSPLTQTVGGVSSASDVGLGNKLRCITICHDTNVSPSSVSSVMGTPTMSVKTLGNLSGYIQCQDASVSINGHDSERDEINSFLNSGFFYE